MIGRRIQRLKIENFKGFQGVVDLDLDAEIVLLVGPNGRGKTSTIEALELAVTGTIGRRVGAKSEFDIRDFVHCDRGSGSRSPEARIVATWSNDGGHDDVKIRQGAGDAIESSGSLNEWRSGVLRGASEIDLVRACTFLYSDSLGSLAGLDLEARRQVIDFFVPNFNRLDELVEQESSRLLVRVEEALRMLEGALPPLERLKESEARVAKDVQEAWDSVGSSSLKFVKRGPALVESQSLKKALKGACGELQVAWSDPSGIQELLSSLSNAAAARARDIESEGGSLARAETGRNSAWGMLQRVLRKIEQEKLS